MSIQSEINRIKGNVNTTLNTIAETGVSVGSGSDALPAAAAALANQKQDKLTFDTTPTAGSGNPVTSGGIKTALDAKASTAVATQSANGLQSASDKKKLDGIETGANKTTVYTAVECTSYTSDSGTCTPAAVKKAVGMFDPKPHTHTKSQITDFPTSMTPTAHNQAASTITAGTLAGKVNANASAAATLGTAQVRDIYAGTADLTPGVSTLATGTIYFVYE